MTQTEPRSGRAGSPPMAGGPDAVPRRWAWLCGTVAGLVGMAVADLSAYLLAPASSPVPAVGSRIIDLLPAALVNWGKDTLGTADKPVLLVIIVAGLLALCAVAGWLELRRPYGGGLVFALVAAVGLVAVLAGGRVTLRSILPTVVGLGAGYLVLRLLAERLRRWQTAGGLSGAGDPDGTDDLEAAGDLGGAADPGGARAPAGPVAASPSASLARRRFLTLAGLTGAAAVVGAVAGRVLVATAGAVEEARSRFRLPTPVSRDPVPAGADLRVEGLSPYLTPNEDFYRIDTALQVPILAAEDWSLRITGMVEREVTISFAELVAKPLVEHVATLTCVSNDVGGSLVGNATWLGYPIRDLLAQAGPLPGADMVLSTSQDGWTAGTPLTALTDPERQALLAVGMNGEALPVEHGYPVRMVVPGLYGYVSATKWVRTLKVTTFAADHGYWTPLGWSARGPVKASARIDVPGRRNVSAGPVVIAGVAWHQHTGIAGVEVGVDGTWRPAELAPVTGPDTWRQWRYTWDATPGRHEIAVRVTNADGERQTEAAAPPAPDGATGWHTITVDVD